MLEGLFLILCIILYGFVSFKAGYKAGFDDAKDIYQPPWRR
jgi:hypothetical protein